MPDPPNGVQWPSRPSAENLDSIRPLVEKNAPHRKTLVSSLTKQYADAGVPLPSRVAELSLESSRTVTTGHQLCLGTGPAFTYYKVLTAVLLAEQLEGKWGVPVIPVFWLASEDHDFDEVRSLWDGQGWHRWTPSEEGGAVGRMHTEGLEATLIEWGESAGIEPQRLEALLGAAKGSLADAMRRWMHLTFGPNRIVVMDGDDADLKATFVGHMSKELTGQSMASRVGNANEALVAGGHQPQVHVRPVNLFHLQDGSRVRVQMDEEGWSAGPDIRWETEEQLTEAVSQSPESFSPNALFRPLYQSWLLPDVAVVGGLAEVSYWMQLAGAFPEFDLVQPALVPRDGVRILPRKLSALARELSVEPRHFGERLPQWEARFISEGEPPSTANWRVAMAGESESALRSFKALDASLQGSVQSTAAKMTKLLDKLDEQGRRAVRRQSKVALDRLARLHSGLFPDGQAQERIANWHALASKWGSESVRKETLESILQAQFEQSHDHEDWRPLLHVVMQESD